MLQKKKSRGGCIRAIGEFLQTAPASQLASGNHRSLLSFFWPLSCPVLSQPRYRGVESWGRVGRISPLFPAMGVWVSCTMCGFFCFGCLFSLRTVTSAVSWFCFSFPESKNRTFTHQTYEDLTWSLLILIMHYSIISFPCPLTSQYPASGKPADMEDPINTTNGFFQQTFIEPWLHVRGYCRHWPGEGKKRRWHAQAVPWWKRRTSSQLTVGGVIICEKCMQGGVGAWTQSN